MRRGYYPPVTGTFVLAGGGVGEVGGGAGKMQTWEKPLAPRLHLVPAPIRRGRV